MIINGTMSCADCGCPVVITEEVAAQIEMGIDILCIGCEKQNENR